MVLGSHAKTRAMYSTPPWPSLAASTAAYRRRSFSDNHPKKRCIFSSISAEYPSMLYSLRQNLLWRKDTPAQACREVILDHILSPDCQAAGRLDRRPRRLGSARGRASDLVHSRTLQWLNFTQWLALPAGSAHVRSLSGTAEAPGVAHPSRAQRQAKGLGAG